MNMSNRRNMLICMLAITALAVTACALAVTPTPTPAPAMTAIPTRTPMPTITLTAAPTRTPRPTFIPPTLSIPTPAFFDALISNDFLFTETAADCRLPCWQGLVVGESSQSDVLDVLYKVFLFEPDINFFETNAIRQETLFQNDYIPNMTVVGNRWVEDEILEQAWLFDLFFWVNNETDTLEAIEMHWSLSDQRFNTPDVKTLIQKMGLPDYFLITGSGTGRIDTATTRTILVYENGLSFYLMHMIYARTDNNITYEYCLDAPVFTGTVSITRPYPSDLNEMTLLQDRFIGRHLDSLSFYDFSSLFSIELSELEERIKNNESLCFEID